MPTALGLYHGGYGDPVHMPCRIAGLGRVDSPSHCAVYRRQAVAFDDGPGRAGDVGVWRHDLLYVCLGVVAFGPEDGGRAVGREVVAFENAARD